eukprot:3042469-Pleurochrysis_carterae.AAC.1
MGRARVAVTYNNHACTDRLNHQQVRAKVHIEWVKPVLAVVARRGRASQSPHDVSPRPRTRSNLVSSHTPTPARRDQSPGDAGMGVALVVAVLVIAGHKPRGGLEGESGSDPHTTPELRGTSATLLAP